MLVSLGFSCQTRFMIDRLTPDNKRQPFDFNITTRPALVRALETDGQSLLHEDRLISIYTMPEERREGVEVGGMYFWHDYPLQEDKILLEPSWPEHVERVNSKYAMLWQRFSDLVRSDEEKTFVLTNSQYNLHEFATDAVDFKRKFGLGRDAFVEIAAALDGFGARNYRLKFLTRSLDDVEETKDLGDLRLEHRHVGILKLKPPHVLCKALFPEVVATIPESEVIVPAG